jgi:hypothetical protein
VNVFYPEPVHFAGEIVVNEDGDSNGLRFLLPLFLAEQLHGILDMEVSRIQNHSPVWRSDSWQRSPNREGILGGQMGAEE